MRLIAFSLCLLFAACAAAPKKPAPEGAEWITAEGISMSIARINLDNKVAAACPNGHETLDERSAFGWLASASKLVRCR